MEVNRPSRVVDAHVHLWDPARSDWYPFLSGGQQLDMGDISGMVRKFDAPTYFEESSRWNIEGFVHVAAAASDFSMAETMELQAQAATTGHPAAIVGSIGPAQSPAETITFLDEQMEGASRFRGVRSPGFETGVPGPEVLAALGERNLVLDVMTHPDQLQEAAAALRDRDDLCVVLEHTGWPRSDSPEERELWRTGMAAFADLGGNAYCKLSGLAMPLGAISADLFRPWIEDSLELFGADRCMFASNFPVDGIRGSFADLYGVYETLTSSLDPADRDKLFASNAEHVYRCDFTGVM